jgi:hypothetical protein
MSTADEIGKLNALRQSGALTDAEFEAREHACLPPVLELAQRGAPESGRNVRRVHGRLLGVESPRTPSPWRVATNTPRVRLGGTERGREVQAARCLLVSAPGGYRCKSDHWVGVRQEAPNRRAGIGCLTFIVSPPNVPRASGGW